MNNHELILELVDELRSFTPLPHDDEIGEKEALLLDRYDSIITTLEQIPQKEKSQLIDQLAPSLLASFGIGDGNGVYWGSLHLLESFGEQYVSFVHQALTSENPGTRGWACIMMKRRKNSDDVPFLLDVLRDSHPYVRNQAVVALKVLAERHNLRQYLSSISELLNDPDEHVRFTAEEVVELITFQ